MKNIVSRLFDAFNKKGIRFCIRGKYSHLPDKIHGSDIDMMIHKSDFKKALRVIDSFGFRFYPFTEPNYFYFLYTKETGMLHLDILQSKALPELEKISNFFVPKDRRPLPNNKRAIHRVWTGMRRRLHYLFSGRVYVFEGPDGSGKSSNAQAVFKALKRVGIRKEFVKFSTPYRKDGRRPTKFMRLYTRIWSLLQIYKNKLLGRVVVTDRYIYLTFRKNLFMKKVLSLITPRPDILFVMDALVSVIRKRKAGQVDQLSEKLIRELYSLYHNSKAKQKISVDTTKDKEKNIELSVQAILENVLVRP